MIVSRPEIARLIEQAKAQAASPEHGLFGPESATWRIARESVVFLGAGRAALLQLAHPYIAHAIAQHSETTRDPIGRFNRTFQALYGMIFGDLATALDAAWRVRGVHDRIHGAVDEDVGRYARGHRYHANDADALLWVHATLVETAVMAHEIGFGPMPPAEKNAYYLELKRAGALFGLAADAVPPDWPAFEAYCARMVASDALAVGRPAREIAGFLMAPASPLIRPAMRWYGTLTAGMLPPRIREAYGLPFGRADQLAYAASLRALRSTWPRIPARLRFRPEYHEAVRRIEGRPGPDRLGRGIEQLVLRVVRPRPV
ncbi:MAG: oxygenase MpaB family protein [Minicystis sp.]